MLKKVALAAVGALILLSAGVARASINDFAVRPGVSVGDTITVLDFTPDGRFVVILHGKPGTVSFFDTWDLALLTGAYADVAVASGNTVGLSLSVSPSAELPFAYVGLSTGEVAVIDYTKVAALGAAEELTVALTVTRFQMSANPVLKIMAVPEFTGKTAAAYLLAGETTGLKWARLAAGNLAGAAVDLNLFRTRIALSRSNKYVYAVGKDNLGGNYLDQIACSEASGCAPLSVNWLIANTASNTLAGLASDNPTDFYSVTYNQTLGQLFLLDNSPSGSLVWADTLGAPNQPVSLAVLRTPRDETVGDLVVAVGGDTVFLPSLATPFTSSLSALNFGATVTELAAAAPLSVVVASGGTDGYIFAGGTAGGISPITANPWVYDAATVNNGVTVGLRFKAATEAVSPALKFMVFKNADFRAWPLDITGGTSMSVDTLTSTSLTLSELVECQNEITIIVQDNLRRQGRAVVTATKNTNPPAPTFTLGFGRQRMVVNFAASDLCDLNRYAIFWGDTNSMPTTDYNLLASYGDSVPVNSPVAGDRIQRVISGLTDGRRYYVQLVAFDASGKAGVSARLSTVPQAVNTVTGAAGETGGFGCGLGRGSDPFGLAWLLLPLLFYAVVRVSRRETR